MENTYCSPGIIVRVDKPPGLSISLDGVTVNKGKKAPIYNGQYEVTPSFENKSLPTAGKLLSRDVTIYEIPVYSVSNPSGGNTVTIGEINYG